MHEGIAGLFGLSGYELIALICALIVIEELGVPMPFLPGDFLLVLAGASVATGHLNLAVVVGAAYVAAVAGALGGREIFARLGGTVLRQFAAWLRVSPQIEGLAARLRRGGSAAVFVGRITPGLRVVTTEVSGLVTLPRRTFVKGLLPGVALYEGVFIGLGVWLGPAAWSTVERFAPTPGQMLLLFAFVVGLAVLGHACAGLMRKDRAPGAAVIRRLR